MKDNLRLRRSNWLATVPGKEYFAILWLYGSTEAAINKSFHVQFTIRI